MTGVLKRFGFGLRPWIRKRIVDPLLQILRRGAEPKQLAFSGSLGITLGVFPICGLSGINVEIVGFLILNNPGNDEKSMSDMLSTPKGVTVFLCGMAIAVLGSLCHAPTVMLTNFIATPIELSLVVPFLRLGEFITGGPHFPLTSDAFKKVLTGKASREVLRSIFHSLLGWVVAAPFIMGTLYILLLPCFKILVRKFSPSSPKKPVQSLTEVRLKVRDV